MAKGVGLAVIAFNQLIAYKHTTANYPPPRILAPPTNKQPINQLLRAGNTTDNHALQSRFNFNVKNTIPHALRGYHIKSIQSERID